MRSTFKIAFYVNKSKEKNGLVPVLGRITINGSIAQFSCKQSIAHELWDAKSNRATGRSDRALKVNRTLDNIRAQITKHYQRISDREAYVNAEMVRNAWQGIGMECDTLLGAFDRHNAGFEKRAGKDRSQSTLYKYLSVRRHLADFIKSRYNRSDLHLKEITEDFIRDFGIYLHITLGLSSSTVWLYSIPLRMIVTKAHNSGIISTNPFAHYHLRQESKERGYLTEDELKLMIDHKFDNRTLEIVRDLFVFAAFTGLSYIDIKNLTEKEIIAYPDGSKWIATHREKTGTPVNVKLLDLPIRIIEKYESVRNGEHLFPVPKNSDCNRRLKIIAKHCGIAKYITFHQSRHSFATLALTKGVPIESVSRMLGHTDITTTQIYAKITNEKIGRDMDMFSEKLDKLNGLESV